MMYNIDWDVCVEEQLVLFKGRCSFSQYMPSKLGEVRYKNMDPLRHPDVIRLENVNLHWQTPWSLPGGEPGDAGHAGTN